MANIFKRLFKVGQAEAHSVIDKLEDPIKMTEQGIRDMKKDLDKSLHALAEVKALAIRSKNDANTFKSKAEDYEKKAMLLLQKAQGGGMDLAEAERLATEALTQKKQAADNYERSKTDAEKHEQAVSQLDGNVKTLRSSITKWENELKTLKARAKVSETTKKINKQLADIDSSGTMNMLERMKEKVEQDEALAESYGEIANESKSIDEELDKALEDSDKVSASNDLEELKKKMGL